METSSSSEGKLPIITRDEYTIYIEESWFGAILHQDVHVRWTPRIKRLLMADLDFLNGWLGELHVAVQQGNDKLAKYVQLLGFQKHCTRYNGAGERFTFYRRLL